MDYEIVWTKRAIAGFDRIVNYLESEWTDKEVSYFVNEANSFFKLLTRHHEILSKTNKKGTNLYRGPLNKYTILTYRVKPRNKQIVLINIRGARQKPLK